MTSAARVRAYRQRQKEKGAADSSQKYAKENQRENARASHFEARPGKPFVGCDGEGCGTDELGRQHYMLLRIGDMELFTGKPLSSAECLDAICDAPASAILVGFAFGYDVTMILRDLPEKRLRRLFAPKDFGKGKSRYVWYKNFDIEYLPKQYFRVRRVALGRDSTGRETRIPVKGSGRTIYETFGFFQKSFLKSIESFDVGTIEQRERIARNKNARADFAGIDQEVRDYCELEVQFLAELMEKLRGYCHAAGIRPRSWNGAGKLASALHALHSTIPANTVNEVVPSGVIEFANMAYYGGRFEISRTGLIGSKVHEYDIRSAYPDTMRHLPCLEHGVWRQYNGKPPRNCSMYVGAISFNHADSGHAQLCGFPVRSKEGHLYWPLRASGIYWGVEIAAAEKLGAIVRHKGGWAYDTHCDCQPFEWIEPLFDYRRTIGSSGPGYPIKLGINSLYGKLAQRIGAGKYANMVWAGLITALTRAKLMGAVALAPDKIIMIATDAVYSLEPLQLDCGEKLGQWEHVALADLFIVQPGLYWSPDLRKRKSRGLPGKFFEERERTQTFESRWNNWKELGGDFPNNSVPLTVFTGLKLAIARGKPETAGIWKEEQRTISFDYTNKREGHIWCGDHIVTAAKPGGAHVKSLPHREFLAKGGAEPWENARAMLEDQPDYVDLGPPFKD